MEQYVKVAAEWSELLKLLRPGTLSTQVIVRGDRQRLSNLIL
jgi:hypothetical protein